MNPIYIFFKHVTLCYQSAIAQIKNSIVSCRDICNRIFILILIIYQVQMKESLLQRKYMITIYKKICIIMQQSAIICNLKNVLYEV